MIVADLASRPDFNSLQTGPPGFETYFSRLLTPVTPEGVRIVRERQTGHAAQTINHEGIDDAALEKYSRVWYWDGKTWLDIPGAD
jgi:hypothetical protein